MTFGENIKALRIARSLSQKDLAEALGFSFQNISKWERGDSLPDIETLLAIARFFGTTTDALLNHVPEEKFSTLRVDVAEMQIFRAYPEEEVRAGGNFIFEIDAEGRIAAIVRIRDFMKNYGVGYYRAHYDPLHEENSSIVFQHRENSNKPGPNPYVTDKARIPEGGFVFILSDSLFVAKKILQFIIPEEYHAFLDPESHSGYAGRNGQQLFSNVLKRNELDAITVELAGSSLIFRKPADTVDPMAVNIEALAKIVRRELERKHNQQIEALTSRLEEVADMADDNESNIGDLESRIDDLESALEEMRARLDELQEDEE